MNGLWVEDTSRILLSQGLTGMAGDPYLFPVSPSSLEHG